MADSDHADADAEPDDDDRREHDRAPIELKVEYKRLNTFFSDYTKNISKGGTFIKTGKPLPIGTEFVFKLFIPKLVEPLRIHGQVQWIVTEEQAALAAPGSEEAAAGMGIRFTYRQGDKRDSIERTVEKLMVDSLGQLLYSRLMEESRQRSGPGDGAGGDGA